MKIIILGGGYGGLLTAFRLMQARQVQVTLVDQNTHFHQRIRHHQHAGGRSPDSLAYADLFHNTNIHFRQGAVNAIDPRQKTVTVDQTPLSYDALVIAIGSYTSVPSTLAPHVLTLDTRDVSALQTALKTAEQKRGDLLVIGGGLTGIEAATELSERYPQLRVTLVTRGALGATVSAKGRRYLRTAFAKRQITLREQTNVQTVEARRAVLDDGTAIPFDVCVWAGSFRAPDLAGRVGLAVNERGQMLINRWMQSISDPAIYGVGDSAYLMDGSLRMACATAMPMGAHVADNLLAQVRGQPLNPFNFGYIVQCISLGRGDGLVQWVGRDDAPAERITTGRLGAMIKALICRFTIWALYAERRLPGFYRWAGNNTTKQDISTERADYGHFDHTNI